MIRVRVFCASPGCTWAHDDLADYNVAVRALSLHAASHRPTEQQLARTFAGAA